MTNQTIFTIEGGGQRIQQNTEQGLPTHYRKVLNADWPVKSGIAGRDAFTGPMWATGLDSLQTWADKWAGKKVRLVELETEGES